MQSKTAGRPDEPVASGWLLPWRRQLTRATRRQHGSVDAERIGRAGMAAWARYTIPSDGLQGPGGQPGPDQQANGRSKRPWSSTRTGGAGSLRLCGLSETTSTRAFWYRSTPIARDRCQ